MEVSLKLSDYAEVRSGLILSRKMSKEKTKFRYNLLNLKSINTDSSINMHTLDVYDAISALPQEYLTQINDIIIRSSTPYTAVLIDENTKDMVVSSNFTIIRTNSKKLLPQFLFWYLNTQDIKKDIIKNSAGNILSAIRPQYFSELEIANLTLSEQTKIADFNLTALKELKLLENLQTEKRKLYQTELEKIYSDYTKKQH